MPVTIYESLTLMITFAGFVVTILAFTQNK
ncbi:putative holin-like toxin [Neobacillus sp. YIM B06451]